MTPERTGTPARESMRPSKRRNSGRFASSGSRPRKDKSTLQIRFKTSSAALVASWSPVVTIHSRLGALFKPVPRCLGGTLDFVVKFYTLVTLGCAQEKPDVFATAVRWASQSNPDASKLIGTKVPNN